MNPEKRERKRVRNRAHRKALKEKNRRDHARWVRNTTKADRDAIESDTGNYYDNYVDGRGF